MPAGIPQKFSDPTFRTLEAEWNKKLKASGLVDCEYAADLSDGKLRDHWIETSRKLQRGVSSGAAEWYRLAFAWLDLAAWPNRRVRAAWAAMADGWSMSDLIHRFPARLTRFTLKPVFDAQTREMRTHFSTQMADGEP